MLKSSYFRGRIMDEKKAQILQQVGELFMRYGIKSVTMDDVAKALKMSKKTLYLYVSDKSDLVRQVMRGFCELDRAAVELIVEAHSDHALDELLEISKMVAGHAQNMHPSIHYDLEKYYPEAWAEFDQFKSEYILNCIADNLKRGIEQGWYRDNVNIPIVSRLYVHKMDVFFDPEIFPVKDFRFVNVYMEMIRYHLHGVASKKGLNYLEKKSAQEKLNFY